MAVQASRKLFAAGCALALSGVLSACGSGAPSDPADQLQQLLDAAGVAAPHQVEIGIASDDKLSVGIETYGASSWHTWHWLDGKIADSDAGNEPRPETGTIAVDQIDFDALGAELRQAAASDSACKMPSLTVRMTLTGARATWVECYQTGYLDGTAKVDGEPVAERFDTTSVADVEALGTLFDAIFAGGELYEWGQSFEGSPGIVVAAPQQAGNCYPEIALETTDPESQVTRAPLDVTCSSSAAAGSQLTPFVWSNYDPAQLAGVRDELVAKGLPEEKWTSLTMHDLDGTGLLVTASGNNPYDPNNQVQIKLQPK